MPITQEMIVKYVSVIKEVTGLNPNILYNSEKQEYPFLCFGLNNQYMAYLNERLGSDFMWATTDSSLVRSELLKNTILGIPSGLLPLYLTDYCSELYQAIEKAVGYKFKSDEERYLFVILHEFGHYHNLMINCKDDHIRYFIELDEQLEVYAMSQKGHDVYRSLVKEKYADLYALKHLPTAIELLTK